MKVAISTDNGFVSAHFGRCPEFTIVEVDAGKISKKETIQNPGHNPGYLPQYLGEKGVEAIIAGGAGQRAQMLFAEKNIQLIVGVSGSVEKNLELLCQGKLVGGESLCQPGGGKGYGLDKSECDHEDGHEHSH